MKNNSPAPFNYHNPLKPLEDAVPSDGNLDYYSTPVESMCIDGFTQFYTLMLAIWQLRPHDLQLCYDLRTVVSRCSFLGWFATAGRKEYKSIEELEPLWNELRLPADIPTTQWSGGISKFMQVVIISRPDLQIDAQLLTEELQLKALAWFFCSNGYKEVRPPFPMPSWQREFLIGEQGLESSRLARLMFTQRKDLQQAFNILDKAGLDHFHSWLNNNALQESGIGVSRRATVETDFPPYLNSRSKDSATSFDKPFGVNLIGYAYGELGIGEDVRMAAKSLDAAGVPFTVFNFSPGEGVRQEDSSIKDWVSDTFPYSINIVCLTAMEHLRLFSEYGSSIFHGRYTIGYWPWELHFWPSKWKHCFNLVDEVWASSSYIHTALAAASPKLSLLMPMAVSVPPVKEPKSTIRERFDIDKDAISFIFSFDGNSSLNRKNPLGVIAAFKEAFPNGTENVLLIIKSMRIESAGPAGLIVNQAAQHDRRIKIIDEMLTKNDVLSLYSACDCFVSLHRSEGFGRGIAEALLLGLDVIATGYGGNIDFCLPLEAATVNYRLIPTTASCYVESDNNFWGDPDIMDAAEHMKRIYHCAHSKQTADDTKRGRESKMSDIFSHQSIGERYRARLERLFKNSGSPQRNI